MASSSSNKNEQDPWEVLEVPALINLSVKNVSNDGEKDQTKSKKVERLILSFSCTLS